MMDSATRFQRASSGRATLRRCLLGSFAIVLLFGCGRVTDLPRVRDGMLDLSSWPFETGGLVPLEGDWEICWNSFVEPESGACPTGQWTLFPVPQLWSDSGVSSPIGGKGIATYRVRIRLPRDSGPFSLRAGAPMTAYRIWIDGEAAGGAGQLGRTASTTVPKLENRDYPLPLGVTDVGILVQVANFDFRGGGLRRTWLVGPSDRIVANDLRELILYTCFATTSGVVGLLFLAQFAFRPSEKARGWLGAFALLVGLRMLPAATSDLPQILLGRASFDLLIRLEYLNTSLLIAVAVAYARSRIPGIMPTRLTRWLLLAALALIPIQIFAPLSIVLATISALSLLGPALILLTIVEYGRAYRSGIAAAGPTLLAASVFGVGIVHDIVRTFTGQGARIELFPYFVIVWLAMESFSLLQAYARAYAKIEVLSAELNEANFELKETEEAIVRFVPFDLLRTLQKGSIREVEGGDHAWARMSVLYCGFHSSPRLLDLADPTVGFARSNELVGEMEECALGYGGFMSDYREDGFQVFFPGSPQDAVHAAFGMLVVARRFIAELPPELRAVVQIGIGIDTGRILVGMLGSHRQLLRIMQGQPLEIAARIEALSVGTESKLLISEETRDGIGDVSGLDIWPIDPLEIQGREPIGLYEVRKRAATQSSETP